jgi:hypothetical protein
VTFGIGEVRRVSDDPLTGIRGSVEIADGDPVVRLSDVLVVELADQMDAWLVGVDAEPGDFVYSSAEHAEPGIVYFYRVAPCWRVGSVWSKEERELEVSLRTLVAAAADYVAAVDHAVTPMGIDLPRLLGARRG